MGEVIERAVSDPILMTLVQRLVNSGVEHLQTGFEIALQMHPQRPPAALGQHVEIAAGLPRLDDAEARLLAGHGKIYRVIGGNLQEYAAVRAALVGLSGECRESGPNSGRV